MNSGNDLSRYFESQFTNINDLLISLKDTIGKDMKVASFAVVKSYNEKEDIWSVTPFPLVKGESTKNVQCTAALTTICKINSEEIEITEVCTVKDIVLILYCDRNFKQNLKQAKNKTTLTALNENSDLHSDKYGVIIKVVKHFKEE